MGLVTLALGAIGIVNIMLIAVTERTREIGLRKALGATNRSIMLHFFAEGVLLTLVSGLIGMALAGGLMALLGNYQRPGRLRSAATGAEDRGARHCQPDAGGHGRRPLSRPQGRSMEPVEALRQE